MTKTIRFALVVSTLLGSGLAAQAAMLAALTGDDTLTMVDTGTMKAGKSMKVGGIAGKIAGIDSQKRRSSAQRQPVAACPIDAAIRVRVETEAARPVRRIARQRPGRSRRERHRRDPIE